MSHIIEFRVEGGGVIPVEVDEAVSGGMVRVAARPGEVVGQASDTLGEALDRVMPAAQTLIAKIQDFASRPDEIQVEFGVKLSGEVGAILAKTGAEANFSVTLVWKGQP